MLENKMLTPSGFRDYLEVEFHHKRHIENTITDVFRKHGYRRITSPMLEYVEVFENKGSVQRDIFKFIDSDGKILALRSDMTPPIARIVATNFNETKTPIRLSYIENTFQSARKYQGKEKEFTQAGVELIGVKSIESDAEILALSIKTILKTGLQEFNVDIGNVNFLQGIIEEINLDKEESVKLQKAIIKGDFVSTEKMIENLNINDGLKYLLSNLPFFTGDIKILEKAKQFTKNRKSLDALLEIESLYNALEEYDLLDYITIDLSMIGHFDYYTGLIIHGYTKHVGYPILNGGRYDTLIENFGVNLPAVGFSIKVNELIKALFIENDNTLDYSKDILVLYTKKSRKSAVKLAENLRDDEFVVHFSLFLDDINENKMYAKTNGISKILVVNDNNDVEEINLL